jgi:hypothetical protein
MGRPDPSWGPKVRAVLTENHHHLWENSPPEPEDSIQDGPLVDGAGGPLEPHTEAELKTKAQRTALRSTNGLGGSSRASGSRWS